MSGRLAVLVALLAAAFPACRDDGAPTDPPRSPIQPAPADAVPPPGQLAQPPAPIEVDFGVIPHGAVRVAELPVPLPELDVALVPLAFQASCSCARHLFVIERSDGSREDYPGDGLVRPESTLRAGDRLLLELTLLTAEKDAVDMPPTTSAGQIVMQEENGARRLFVPVRYRFGIDAPFALTPFPRLEFDAIARPMSLTLPVVIRCDRPGVTLGEPEAVGHIGDVLVPVDDVRMALRPDGDAQLLEVTFRPAPSRATGPFAFDVVVPTDLVRNGDRGPYLLRIPVTGRIVPTIEVAPPERFAFGRISFDEPSERSLVVTDHDPSRAADFVVVGLRTPDGADLSEHFEVAFRDVSSSVRSREVVLRYRGTLDTPQFRGVLALAKSADAAPLVEIDFVGFRRPPPAR
ncbi:MAG: hypothetical protein IPM29_19720 [Planctomycetes bacterium]|nr:hypothetical protein [Planctomycetota bacterium]